LRFPVYVIQTKESSSSPPQQSEPSYEIQDVFRASPQKVKINSLYSVRRRQRREN
jgi:hypothetical protein